MNKTACAVAGRSVGAVFVACVASSVVALRPSPAASAEPPVVSISPPGNDKDGQTVSVKVGPNGYFTPHARINLLECADPGGLTGNLPKDISTCDGNTIQGSTVLVGSDGSFAVSDYPVYLLPSQALGEQSNYQPVCNQTSYCVLYVGQNQNDFTVPKAFSTPFLVSPSAGGSSASTTVPGSSSTETSGGSSTATQPGSPAISSATLANTGWPARLFWIAAVGTTLVLTGAIGRRLVHRRAP